MRRREFIALLGGAAASAAVSAARIKSETALTMSGPSHQPVGTVLHSLAARSMRRR